MAHKTHAVFYSWQNFKYLNETKLRTRPTVAVALIGNSRSQAPALWPATVPRGGVKKKSIAIYSTENVAVDSEDWFLAGHDAGHLIAASLGGVNLAINLVPMALDENRGGGWREIEKRVKALPWGAFRVECRYENSIDPRIPVQVTGTAYSLTEAQVQNLVQTGTDPTPLLVSNNMLGGASITQDPCHVVPPTVRYSTAGARLKDLFCEYPLPSGWRLETAALSKWKVYTGLPDPANPGKKVGDDWVLPAVESRTNAWFDYLALEGHLSNVVTEVLEKKVVAIDAHYLGTVYKSGAVPPEMRNLLMTWNGVYYQYQLADQKIYRCEATDDAGVGRSGFTLAPEIDHIIPSSLRGPTLFSNLRVTSREFNNARGNRADLVLLAAGVPIGLLTEDRKRRGEDKGRAEKKVGFYRD